MSFSGEMGYKLLQSSVLFPLEYFWLSDTYLNWGWVTKHSVVYIIRQIWTSSFKSVLQFCMKYRRFRVSSLANAATDLNSWKKVLQCIVDYTKGIKANFF